MVGLPSMWTVTFSVPIRFQDRFNIPIPLDQLSSKLCENSVNLERIIAALDSAPAVHRMVQGSMSLFQDKIECMWESPQNAGGAVLRLCCCSSEAAVMNTYHDAKILCPIVDPKVVHVLWRWTCSLLLARSMEISALTASEMVELAVNGCYVKADKDLYTIEIWFRTRDACAHAVRRFRLALRGLDVTTQYTATSHPDVVLSLPGVSFPRIAHLDDGVIVMNTPVIKPRSR